MIELQIGQDQKVAEWVGKRAEVENLTECTTYGFFKDGKIVGGAIFYDWRVEDMVFSGAFEDKGCFTKRNLKLFFDYPFNQVGCHRISAYTSVDNSKANTLLKKLGFTKEGCFREISSRQEDANIYGMLKRECIWLNK
jgi:RimJ/RimL family protein N-acetyltransferase